jgi:hypothetical protein
MSEILSQNSVDFRQTLRYAWDCGAIRSLNIPYRFAKRKGGIYETGKPKIHYFICQAQPGGRTGRRIKQHSESKADAGKIRRR